MGITEGSADEPGSDLEIGSGARSVDRSSEDERSDREPGAGPGKPYRSPRRDVEEWRHYAEDQIADSMRRGDFDDLPGRGRPIRWETARDDEHWLANHMLKNSGFIPGWIEERKAILSLLEELSAWQEQQVREIVEAKASEGARSGTAERFVAEFRQRADALNEKIRRFNMSVPTDSVQTAPVAIERHVVEILAALGD